MSLNPISQIKADLGINPDGQVQRAYTNACYRYMDKYAPMDTGALRLNVDIQPDDITYQSEYAEEQYKGIVHGRPVRNYTTPRNWSILG